MNKIANGISDYEILKNKFKLFERFLNTKELDRLVEEKLLAEKTLKKVQDLINSNMEIACFHSAKKELNKPIDDYFKKVK